MGKTMNTVEQLHTLWSKAFNASNKAREARTNFVLSGEYNPIKGAKLIAKADAARALANSYWEQYLEESAKVSIDR